MQLQHRLSSSIGTKLLIALTGLGLFVFLIAHLAGNLLFIAGPGAFNAYSHSLVSNPLIYVAEVGLIVIFVLHLAKTLANFFANRRARPIGYSTRRWAKTKSSRSRKSLASTTMILTGTITLLFVVTHHQSPDDVRIKCLHDRLHPGRWRLPCPASSPCRRQVVA